MKAYVILQGVVLFKEAYAHHHKNKFILFIKEDQIYIFDFHNYFKKLPC
jgi:hypothetical protein